MPSTKTGSLAHSDEIKHGYRRFDFKKNVLVVDDDIVILNIVSQWMKKKGWDVTAATGGKEAFDLMSENNYSLVITDFSMPNINGLILAEKIKSIYPFVPVILITGAEPNVITLENNIIFIDDVLYKPFSLKDLDSKVSALTAEDATINY